MKKGGGRQELSINVFLCRDYLAPYDSDHRSQHDWDRNGLNLVIMRSLEVRLFEGQAGLEIRRLRGPGKFVALCNCASKTDDQATGSALIGPTSRRRSGDVIDRLPAGQEGLLTAEMDLDRVEHVIVRPDKTEHDPLRSIARYSLRESAANGRVNFEPLKEPIAEQRGVWHPAYLEFLGREIVMRLASTRRASEVRKHFENEQVRLVSAAALVGVHDYLFRSYDLTGHQGDFFGPPYWAHPVGELFHDKEVLIVKPKDIWKYRTLKIEQTGWVASKKAIERLIPLNLTDPERRKRIQAIGRLSRNWNDPEVSLELRKLLEPVFVGQEEAPALGPTAGNFLRQRYIMISIHSRSPRDWESFQREILGWLVEVDQVRSIYRTVHEGLPHFDVWLDVVSEPYATDALTKELQLRCDKHGIDVGLRSMEVMEYLALESVEGIYPTDLGITFRNFFGAVREATPSLNLDMDLVGVHQPLACRFGEEYCQQSDMLQYLEDAALSDHHLRFYGGLFAWNFSNGKRDEAVLKEARNRWSEMYRTMEQRWDDVTRRVDLAAIKANLRPETAEAVGKNPLRLLFHVVPEELFGGGVKELKTKLGNKFFEFRNDITHQQNRWRPRLDLCLDARPGSSFGLFEDVVSHTKTLILVLQALEAYEESQTSSAAAGG